MALQRARTALPRSAGDKVAKPQLTPDGLSRRSALHVQHLQYPRHRRDRALLRRRDVEEPRQRNLGLAALFLQRDAETDRALAAVGLEQGLEPVERPTPAIFAAIAAATLQAAPVEHDLHALLHAFGGLIQRFDAL